MRKILQYCLLKRGNVFLPLIGFNTQSSCLQLEYFRGFEIMSIFLISDSFIELLKMIQTEDKCLFYKIMTTVSLTMVTVKRNMTKS